MVFIIWKAVGFTLTDTVEDEYRELSLLDALDIESSSTSMRGVSKLSALELSA